MSLNPRLQDWQQQRVWLIGASSGIGLALAEALLAAGAQVVLSARRRSPLEALATRFPRQAHVLPLDITQSELWPAAYAQLRQALGELDLLLFCAADYQPMRAWDLNMEQAEHMLATNLNAALRSVATVLPDMLAQGRGYIALIASVAGYTGLPRSLVYGPSKAALINFCEALYLDLHPRGLGVSVINPGFVATPLTANNNFAMPELIQPQKAAQEILKGLAAGEFEIHFPKRFTRKLKLLRLLPYRLRFKALAGITEAS